jgi:hypothetical protein
LPGRPWRRSSPSNAEPREAPDVTSARRDAQRAPAWPSARRMSVPSQTPTTCPASVTSSG